VILTSGYFKSDRAKTAHGLIRHGRTYRIVAVVDPPMAGQDAGYLFKLNHKIPIVARVEQAPKADFLIIGVAPPGGRLPADWRDDIKTAMSRGMNIISGLHDFLADDLELARYSTRHNVSIWDVRRPPSSLKCATGNYKPSCPVVLTVGTEAAVGKRTTSLCLMRLAEQIGINVGFLATGQTGMMIGCDEGVVADRLPADFLSGEIEKRIEWIADSGKELIVVEGNGALSHPAYGPVAHGILTGSHATHLIMCHDPSMTSRGSFSNCPIPTIEEEMAIISKLSDAKLMGIALRTRSTPNWRQVLKDNRKKFGVPAIDPVRHSSALFLKALDMWRTPKLGKVKGDYK